MSTGIRRLYAGTYTGYVTALVDGRATQVDVWIVRQSGWPRDAQWSLTVTAESGEKLVHSTDCASRTLRECREQLRLQIENGYSR